MNDLLNDPKALIGWLLTALMGLVMFTWRRNDAEQNRRIEELEKKAVNKADIDQRHRENIDRLDKLEDRFDMGISGVHKRIDDIFDRLPPK